MEVAVSGKCSRSAGWSLRSGAGMRRRDVDDRTRAIIWEWPSDAFSRGHSEPWNYIDKAADTTRAGFEWGHGIWSRWNSADPTARAAVSYAAIIGAAFGP